MISGGLHTFFLEGGNMSYLALYRKWRPMTFKDVVEQEHVMKTLTNSVITGRIAHAYLFVGQGVQERLQLPKFFPGL